MSEIIGDIVRISIIKKRAAKKSCFLSVFLLTMFEAMLKYPYVYQKANINRQQAKMTFQFACRKLQRSKDLEPAGPAKLACPVRVLYTLMGSIFKKKEGITVITGYPDNHCLITRYPDNRYETRLTQPKRAAQPLNEIPLYNCRGFSTNQPFLCKTNPMSRTLKLT